ncbi:LytR/AlgR family response regulator transcription factor [Thalassomonas actiniarum]|uniref:Response regulator transcription factor n=1 Tax=Thalassomonas actiniarum TaxID=485447 RepID=A0AAE9YMJ4_9GAMM|nr:LytTR family DNA-binding domain-containing protein [Thalassomonas actiniarum]WDD97023.1 response regulator transcription factor [Thalassomonas actiniarum]
MLKVLVADREVVAQESIVQLLENEADVEVLPGIKEGRLALEICRKQQVDIIFLDVEIPGINGLELARALTEICQVIFVSSHKGYALDAFELNAVDYLLKPLEAKRFSRAFNKAKAQLQTERDNQMQDMVSLMQHLMTKQEKTYKSRLVIKDPGHIRLIDVDQVNYITGAGNYADVHMLEGKHYLHRETLTALERQLDPKEFLRIHRSTIIRSSSVSELYPNDNGDYTVIIKTGEQLTLSRRNKNKLEQLIGLV